VQSPGKGKSAGALSGRQSLGEPATDALLAPPALPILHAVARAYCEVWSMALWHRDKTPFLCTAGTLGMQFSAKQRFVILIIVTNTGSSKQVLVQLTHNTPI